MKRYKNLSLFVKGESSLLNGLAVTFGLKGGHDGEETVLASPLMDEIEGALDGVEIGGRNVGVDDGIHDGDFAAAR